MPDAAAHPTARLRGRFHLRVAAVVAASTAVMALGLVGTMISTGDHLAATGMRLRAESMARTAAASLAGGAAPSDAASWLESLRRGLPEVRSISLRDLDGNLVAVAVAPGRAPPTVKGSANIPEGGAWAGGRIEYLVERDAMDRLQIGGAGVVSAVALLLVAASALVGFWLARRLTRPVVQMVRSAKRMAEGDLRVEVAGRGADEMGALAESFNALAQGLRRMVVDLGDGAGQMTSQAQAIGERSRNQFRTATGQSAALESAASTMAEVAQASRISTESAQFVIEVAERSETLGREGSLAVRQSLEGLAALEEQVAGIAAAVTELSERTVQIAGIIAAVKDLSEQSNVLALNAAIEAAKVGAAGQGFAVVAEEMRRLAEQSRRATDEVRTMLVDLQRATRKVVAATAEGSERARSVVAGARQASGTIDGLASAIVDSSRAARAIADTTRRQTEEMDGIAAAVEYLHHNMGDTVSGALEVEEAAGELSRISEQLARAVRGYRT